MHRPPSVRSALLCLRNGTASKAKSSNSPYLAVERSWLKQVKVLGNKMIVLMDPAKLNQDVDPLRVNRTREKRFVFEILRQRFASPRSRSGLLCIAGVEEVVETVYVKEF